MRWIGIDVGGANLKLSDGYRYAASMKFELWRHREKLAGAIAELLSDVPPVEAVAATMTGELADCYETKAEGVRHITQSLVRACGDRHLRIYGVDGKFHAPDGLESNPHIAAASNWHALARMAAGWLPKQTGLVLDIGSTTADIIPVRLGKVATDSRTDADRLLAGELVYTGVARTPICAIVQKLPYRSSECPVAAELFATTADVYHLLGEAISADGATADGRAITRQNCIDRLARQVCADRDSFTEEDARRVAQRVKQQQTEMLHKAIDQTVPALELKVDVLAIVSGSGEWLARQVAERHNAISSVCSLSERLGSDHSSCAAAAAVARLAAGEIG